MTSYHSTPTRIVLSNRREVSLMVPRLVSSLRRPVNGRLAAAQVLLYLFFISLLVAGCAPTTGSGTLNRLADLSANCPTDGQLASYVALDISGSRSEGLLTASDRAVIVQAAEQTAVCSGTLKTVIFSNNAASTATLYNNKIAPDGATDIAKFKRVPALVSEVMKSIDQTAVTASWPDPSGSDIVAQFGLAAEYATQTNQPAGKPVILNVWIVTDGFQTVGLDVSTLTTETATQVADQVRVPQLPGAKLTLAGVGQTTSKDVSTNLSEAIRTFWQRVCERTNAASCTVLTDTSQAGK